MPCALHVESCGCNCGEAAFGQTGEGKVIRFHDRGCPADASGDRACPADRQCPCRHNGPCQGVCGGAVFEKPVSFVFEHDVVLQPLAILQGASQHILPRRLRLASPSDRLSGRLLRTLYVSLLC